MASENVVQQSPLVEHFNAVELIQTHSACHKKKNNCLCKVWLELLKGITL